MAHVQPQTAKLPPGDFQFESRREIGFGGFARVFAVKFRGEEVVVKVPHVPGSPEDAEKEISNLASIAHRNIVRFIGIVGLEARTCPVLELAPLGSVRDVMRKGQLTLLRDSRQSWLLDVAKALKYLHADAPTPMVHGDVKGANVLIFPDSYGKTLAKLSDFGQARSLLETTAADNMGTHLWSAPEVIADEVQSKKSDTWSFGCTAVEMVSEKEPFHHQHRGDRREIRRVLRRVEGRELDPLHRLEVTWPPGLLRVVQRCLQLEYTHRPSMEEVLRDLQAGPPPSTPPATEAPQGPQATEALQDDVKDAMENFLAKTEGDPAWAPDFYICKVIALTEYSGEQADDLSFEKNQIIYVVDQRDDGWWQGVTSDMVGMIPSSLVRVCD